MMAKLLIESFKNNPAVRIQASGPSRLFVWADPQTHLDIDRYLNVRPPEPKLAIFPLHVLDSTKLADSLKLMFPGAKDGSPFIEADTEQNKIRVRGTPELVQEVEKAIKMMDDNPAMRSGGMSVINLDKGKRGHAGGSLEDALSATARAIQSRCIVPAASITSRCNRKRRPR